MTLPHEQSIDRNNPPELDITSKFIHDEVNQATTQIEELWGKLARAWPAIQENPEIVGKIEKLWNNLKGGTNGTLALSSEIDALITPPPSSLSSSDEIDELLSEILGENYRFEMGRKKGNSSHNTTIRDTNKGYITGSKELDEMVAAILGEGWEKDNVIATMNSTSSSGQQPLEPIKMSLGNSNGKEPHVPGKAIDIDTLNDSLPGNIIDLEQAGDDETPGAAHKLFELENIEINKNESTRASTSPYLETVPEQENLEDIINEILHEDETETEPHPMEVTEDHSNQDKGIDELISEILKEDNELPLKNEDLDEVNRYINKPEVTPTNSTEIETEPTSSSGSRLDTHATPDRRPPQKTSSTSDVTLIDHKARAIKAPLSQNVRTDKNQHKIKHHHNGYSNAASSLIFAVILIVSFSSWRYFSSSNGPTYSTVEKSSLASNLSGINKRTKAPEETEPSINELNTIDATEAEEQHSYFDDINDNENYTPYNTEHVYDESNYKARIEQTDTEITITINGPGEYESNTLSDAYGTSEFSSDEDKSSSIYTENSTHTVGNGMAPPEEAINTNVTERNKPTIIVHTISKGDTLWAIAKRYVDDPYKYPELAKVSKIKNPDRIYPGNKIRIIKYPK